MIKEIHFSTLSSAVEFTLIMIHEESASVESVIWAGGRTKIILSFPSRENTRLSVTLPYYSPLLVEEALGYHTGP